jgi:hypothetical protein
VTDKNDDIVRQAMGRLYFQHMDRISRMITGEINGGSMDMAVKHASSLVSPWLDDDDDFSAEMKAVAEAYAPENRPPDLKPLEWRQERRLEELECIHRNAAGGVFKQFKLPIHDTPI